MNILVVNQPSRNHGDEAAHLALMRALSARYPKADFTVLFVGMSEQEVAPLRCGLPRIRYVVLPLKGSARLPALAIRNGLDAIVEKLHPVYREIGKMMDGADFILNAPGGMDMGGFRTWSHLFYLRMAVRRKKPVAYYARSIGPFGKATRADRRFLHVSEKLLGSFCFLSLRDAKSMEYAKEVGVPALQTIDTAFLERPRKSVPDVWRNCLKTDYLVFVPNELRRLVGLGKADADKISHFALAVLDLLARRHPDCRIAMLPQLFGRANGGDGAWFARLRDASPHRDRVVVLPDTLSSDIQQTLISSAKLMVGARYHSVVFALNNQTPFVSLTYEHKMTGLLQLVGQPWREVGIMDLGTEEFDEPAALAHLGGILDRPDFASLPDPALALRLARDNFDVFCRVLESRVPAGADGLHGKRA